jgi:hypothetical protein
LKHLLFLFGLDLFRYFLGFWVIPFVD